MESHTLRHAAAIHATSELEAREIRALGLDLAPLRTIENGIDELPATTQVKTDVRAWLALTADEPFILYLGRLSWKKGLDRLVRAMRHIAAGKLVIAGNDDEGYWPALQKIIADMGMSERVLYCGPAYGERKWALLRAAACFVLPSYSENFGNTVLEAMSVGCPAVVTDAVGASGLLKNADAGLVVSGDPETIGRAVSYLLQNEATRVRMGEAGMRAAREQHSWAQRADEMLDLYHDLAEQKGRGAKG